MLFNEIRRTKNRMSDALIRLLDMKDLPKGIGKPLFQTSGTYGNELYVNLLLVTVYHGTGSPNVAPLPCELDFWIRGSESDLLVKPRTSVWVPEQCPTLSKFDDLLNYLLLVSPNTTTFWNFKRKALLNSELSVDPELRFTQLILNKYPRSYETIFHRQWIIHRYNYLNDHKFLLSELELCNKFADKYRCNYGLWQYRRFLLLHQQNPETYKIELNNLNVWLAKHPTDISGWSYLECVLDVLVSQSMVVALSPMLDDQKLLLENSTRIIQSYFEKVHDILELYPERECVWMFRRRLITFWIQLNRYQSSYNSNESIMKLLNQVEPLLPKTLNIITQLKSSKIYFTGFSFNEFLNWSYRNNLCKEPSTFKWTDLLSWRYLFWLSEYLSSLLKKLELIG